jgi:hypothetical protein
VVRVVSKESRQLVIARTFCFMFKCRNKRISLTKTFPWEDPQTPCTRPGVCFTSPDPLSASNFKTKPNCVAGIIRRDVVPLVCVCYRPTARRFSTYAGQHETTGKITAIHHNPSRIFVEWNIVEDVLASHLAHFYLFLNDRALDQI